MLQGINKAPEIETSKCKECGQDFYEGETLALACYDFNDLKAPRLLSYKAREIAMLTLTCVPCTIQADQRFVAEQLVQHMNKKFKKEIK
tara:strand:+ start:685 stop:951 length:267 start_codon:yes stop_codon:yes gene_type:complete